MWQIYHLKHLHHVVSVTFRFFHVLDYYWRESIGVIPHDAVQGGVQNGVVTYVGQTLYPKREKTLLPGYIIPGKKTVYSCADVNEFQYDLYVQVRFFCT